MAITMRCKTCQTEFKLGKKVCPKCNVTLNGEVVYRVAVKPQGQSPVKRTAKTLRKARMLEAELLRQREAGTLMTKKAAAQAAKKAAELEKRRGVGLTFSEAGAKYMNWAKGNKRTWLMTKDFSEITSMTRLVTCL